MTLEELHDERQIEKTRHNVQACQKPHPAKGKAVSFVLEMRRCIASKAQCWLVKTVLSDTFMVNVHG